MVGVVDPLRLLEHPEARVAGHVQREQPRRTDLATRPQPHQKAGQAQVPDQLEQEGGLERRVALIPRRTMRRGDLQAEEQLGGRPEQLLVEVVADPADGLGDQQAGRGRLHEAEQVVAPQTPVDDEQPDEHAAGDPAPDAEPAVPDREHAPPVIGDLAGGGDVEVDPSTDQTGRERPHRDLVGQVGVTAHRPPAPAGDEDRRGHREHVGDPVGMEEQRPDAEPVVSRAGDEGERGHARHPGSNRGSTRSLRVAATASRLNGAISCVARRS